MASQKVCLQHNRFVTASEPGRSAILFYTPEPVKGRSRELLRRDTGNLCARARAASAAFAPRPTSDTSITFTKMPNVAVGIKNKGKNPSRDRRSRSRQGTPASATTHVESSPAGNGYFQTPFSGPGLTFAKSFLDIISEKPSLPSPSSIGLVLEATKSFNSTSARRGDRYDSLLREATSKLKEVELEERERERVENQMAQEEEQRKQKLKKVVPKKREREEERPPAVGEHKVARQDGAGVNNGM